MCHLKQRRLSRRILLYQDSNHSPVTFGCLVLLQKQRDEVRLLACRVEHTYSTRQCGHKTTAAALDRDFHTRHRRRYLMQRADPSIAAQSACSAHTHVIASQSDHLYCSFTARSIGYLPVKQSSMRCLRQSHLTVQTQAGRSEVRCQRNTSANATTRRPHSPAKCTTTAYTCLQIS